MPEEIKGLPLDIVRTRARIHTASSGAAMSNLYVRDVVYREG